ncbi:MAG: YerC/YecD family TrpR-related protein [Candidatus Roizmanbacteria bacterium]
MSTHYQPKSDLESNLFKSFQKVHSEQDAADFLRDLLTPAEIEEFSHRLEIARLLSTGKSYLDVAKKVGVSTTTVTRVAQWLHDGCGGYKRVLEIE